MLSSDMVTLLDVFQTIKFSLELTDQFGMVNEHAAESSNIFAKLAGVRNSRVAADDPAFL